jgi:UDP-N-acetylglucosamine--N-acetylmuramyl-(pentapeptide) pyrophosphoryl-undecaprenol N-acetylglucosamine transferase
MSDERRSSLEKVMFAGGGTGGHVYMSVAIVQELKARSPALEVLFAGTAEGLESRILPRLGYRLETIRIGGMKQVGLIRRLRTFAQLPASVAKSLRIVRSFRPNVMVGLGGYSSGPPLLAGGILGIPSLLIEPNVYPGFANRLLRPFAGAAAVAFEETARWFGAKARVTGVPVRREFFLVRKRDFRKPPTVLVFGGSRGSRPINRIVVDALPHLPRGQVRLIHQTGAEDYESVAEAYRIAGWEAEVAPYIDDMPSVFGRADLLICRAGASTIAEIAAAGRPALLIPFPHAADDHQRHNARTLEAQGAAVLLDQERTSGSALARTVVALVSDRPRLARMAEKCAALGRPDAADQIIDLMEEIVRR